MAIRTVNDRNREVEWRVWAVHPRSADRRRTDRRVRIASIPMGHDRRVATIDRRLRQRAIRLQVKGEMAAGWLAFDSEVERRRLAPIPERWETLSNVELRALAEQAQIVPRRVPKSSS